MSIKNYLLLICFFLFFNCKNDEKLKTKKDILKEIKKEKQLLEFDPKFITKLNMIDTDSILLEDFYHNNKQYSKWVKFQYKNKVDTAFTLFKEAKYNFQLKTSFIQEHDYKLIIKIKNKEYTYFFKNIDYDSIQNGKIIYYTTKSYILNNKKYGMYDAVYYLE